MVRPRPPAQHGRPGANGQRDPGGQRGSVLPLVLGMVLCLLLLGAGVTAATSGFLARGRLQHACDGAASAAADTARRTFLLTGHVSEEAAAQQAALVLSHRATGATAAVVTSANGVRLSCTGTAAITFGALFGVAEMTLTVQAAGLTTLS